MTIASAFNEIAVAQGGTANTSGTIAGAIDALNDALAGSDQAAASTIEGAVRLLGSHISAGGGGGGGEAQTTDVYLWNNGDDYIDAAHISAVYYVTGFDGNGQIIAESLTFEGLSDDGMFGIKVENAPVGALMYLISDSDELEMDSACSIGYSTATTLGRGLRFSGIIPLTPIEGYYAVGDYMLIQVGA